MFSTCKSVNDDFNKTSFSHDHETVCTNKFIYILGDPLSLTPCLEKGPLKLKKGAHLTLIGQFLKNKL